LKAGQLRSSLFLATSSGIDLLARVTVFASTLKTMFDLAAARAALDAAIEAEGEACYVSPSIDRREAMDDVLVHLCEPFDVTAQVMPPGFAFAEIGRSVSAVCIAHRDGNWLVYQPDERRFVCFWGTSREHLGAHGVVGNPLYCWTA
jgi:hypothetical protein